MPAKVILQPAKVSTPAVADFGFAVQVSAPPPGFVPMARVIESVLVVTRVAFGVLDGDGRLSGPCDAARAAAGLSGEGQLERRACSDIESAAGDDGQRVCAVRGRQLYSQSPTLLRDMPEKVAPPFTALTGVVPVSVLPPGLVPMARLIQSVLPVPEVMTLPPASSTLTAGDGLIGDAAAVVVGCVVKTSLAGGPMETAIDVLTGFVRPAVFVVFRVYVPARLRLHPAKVATPATVVTGLVVQVKVPGPAFTANVTARCVPVVTTLPSASSMETTGCCVKAVPPVAVALGSVVKASCVAVPEVCLNVALVPLGTELVLSVADKV